MLAMYLWYNYNWSQNDLIIKVGCHIYLQKRFEDKATYCTSIWLIQTAKLQFNMKYNDKKTPCR